MAKKKPTQSGASAALKRSIARRFNDALAGRTPKSKPLDQRTARKLARYRKELRAGAKGGDKKLSALEIAKRVHELLEHGERLSDIKKLAKPKPLEYDEEKIVALLSEMQPVYRFRPEAYQFAGVRNETLLAAGVIKEIPRRRGRRSTKS
jgi:hypothetical protein